MVGTGEIKYPGGSKLTLLPGSLILIYQGLEEESPDQKSPGPPGWGLTQRASSSLITKKQEMLKKTKHQTSEIRWRNREEWRLISGRQRQLLKNRTDR